MSSSHSLPAWSSQNYLSPDHRGDPSSAHLVDSIPFLLEIAQCVTSNWFRWFLSSQYTTFRFEANLCFIFALYNPARVATSNRMAESKTDQNFEPHLARENTKTQVGRLAEGYTCWNFPQNFDQFWALLGILLHILLLDKNCSFRDSYTFLV